MFQEGNILVASELFDTGTCWSDLFSVCAVLFAGFNVYFFRRRWPPVFRPFLPIAILLIAAAGRTTLCLQPANYDLGWLIVGLIVGQGLFLLSLAINRLSIAEPLSCIASPRSHFSYSYEHPFILIKSLLIAFYEELLWRGTIVYLLGNSSFAVIASSLWFTSIHLHKRKEFVWVEWLDLLLFSMLLGLLFLTTTNLLFVTVIHAVRNINVICFVQQQKNDYCIPGT